MVLHCPLQQHLQDCHPPLFLRVDSDKFSCFLMSLRGTLVFQSSIAALILEVFFRDFLLTATKVRLAGNMRIKKTRPDKEFSS
jgi:hypothetical protein